jgi:UDPglucose 6-dehydrogenase/GDP-mannose 6-dehydrogenase
MMRVAIIGAGHVGLVTGACLADKGHRVLCVDVDQAKVDAINRGVCPFYEKGLEELLKRNLNVRLKATTDLRGAVLETDLSFVAVGTPFDGREIDLTYVKEAARQIGQALRDKSSYHVVVVKSTVVPGTTDAVVRPILEEASGRKAGPDFGVGMNPEFLTEGEAVEDFMHPDRLILGGIDGRSVGVMDDLYSPFAGVDRLRTNTRTAEMIKYASNALLATLISFSNELGNLGSALGGIDVVEVMRGLHLSKYLSPVLPNGERVVPAINSFLMAGCGFGGSCLPKDVMALMAHGKKRGLPMRLLQSVLSVNEEQPRQVLARLRKHFPSLAGVRVAVLGLAFRPDTDDIRESPALPIIKALLSEGAQVQAYDPAAKKEAQKVFARGEVTFAPDLPGALEGAQAIALLTRWEEFRRLPELLAGRDPQPLVVDGRRLLDKSTIARYEGIGL